MLRIELPGKMEIVSGRGGFRFRGTASEIKELAEAIRVISKLPIGGFATLGSLELFVSNEPSKFENRVALPAEAWNILASKFSEVAYDWESSPFDFNDCGYIRPLLSIDLGVELIGEPLPK